MSLDAVLLSRVQFGFSVSFHIIFPTISIGLALFLALMEGQWLRTRNEIYLTIYKFWLNIFAMAFGVGVVTGIVLSFEFGTNFASFAQKAGPVIGPLIGLEVLTSFFLEAGFLGIMLFGFNRVGPRLHFLATCLVALGTILSASWILSANSWMQTPDGVVLRAGHFEVISWWRVIFNPSYPYRLAHMLIAAYLTVSFLVAGVGAYYVREGRHLIFARKTMSLGLTFATALVGAQVFLGDVLAGVIAVHQPAKLQAIEGNWDDQPRAPYQLIIVPDSAEARNHYTLGIPLVGSIMVTHSIDGAVPGLKRTAPRERPPMGPVFYAFRIMYLIGTGMFAIVCIAMWLRLRGRLYSTGWFLSLLIGMAPAGLLATLGGWYTAEIGRQPYVVFGLLRTADTVSPVAPKSVLVTLLALGATYTLFMTGFLVLAGRAIRRGPSDEALTVSGSLKRGTMVVPGPPGLNLPPVLQSGAES
ncbi:MAG: cytochrome ubiquinol oxidase subunit [Gammaproteobacteria bacterium]|nr:cytochrome ubiquinol oxidase subunit [Gammaproteobacteria bacterium]